MNTRPVPHDAEPEKLPITSITLGGFQVFDEPTTLPLGKLTFLFGPNSAGKSAVEDGLGIILGLLEDGASGIADDLRRHWRISGQTLVPSLTIGITAAMSVDLRGVLNEDLWSEVDFDHETGLSFRFFRDADSDKIFSRALFVLSVDQIPLLEVVDREYFGVNFSHPILKGLPLAGDYQTLSERTPTLISYQDGWARILSPLCTFDRHMEFDTVWSGLANAKKRPPTETWEQFYEMLRAAVSEAIDFFNEIRGICIAHIAISPDVVTASRKIPTPRELTFLLNSNPALDSLDLLHGSSPLYRELATSYLSKRIGTAISDIDNFTCDASLIDAVNKALRDHLFLERGYAVGADFRAIVPFDEFGDLSYRVSADTPTLVQLHLTDSEGRKQAFDQVGSGLGYVLPVLCSVCNVRGISLIQQPELHLHPALQAAIGDVFIEYAGEAHQLIVETHSEHLLLRVLKRIRQTTQGKAPAPELKLRPDDVAVVYFDPKPNGTTTVKRLRISEEGDFLDRWPRGFFTERDSELFDE